MPALNFQERFATPVQNGQKRQTIRRIWKRPIKAGDTLYLYTGMRTHKCRCLRKIEICKSTEEIEIRWNLVVFYPIGYLQWDLNRFAKYDGFNNWIEMRNWFDKKYGLPFRGVLIEW